MTGPDTESNLARAELDGGADLVTLPAAFSAVGGETVDLPQLVTV